MALTSAQIVTLALQIAKAPGYTAQAGQLLNAILQELCQDYDFEIARGLNSWSFNSVTGNMSGPYTMPADFLRSKKDDVWYTIYGQPYVMIPIELAEYDRLSQTQGLNSYPEFFASDMSQTPPVIYVWPPPSGSFQVSQRYYRLMPDITTPETSATVPWFQNTNYLITRLAGEVMKITDDERVGIFLSDAEPPPGTLPGAGYLLRKFLQMKDDPEGYVRQVTLDRRMFGRDFSRLKNTKVLGW